MTLFIRRQSRDFLSVQTVGVHQIEASDVFDHAPGAVAVLAYIAAAASAEPVAW